MKITFIDSVQGHQTERVKEMAERVRKSRPGVGVVVVTGDAAKAALLTHKLNFGPAIVIDDRLEYVGIPRWRFLWERIAQVAASLPNPRTAAPAETKATPAPSATAQSARSREGKQTAAGGPPG